MQFLFHFIRFDIDLRFFLIHFNPLFIICLRFYFYDFKDDSLEDCIVQAQEHIPSEQDVELQDEHANLENLPLEEYVPG